MAPKKKKNCEEMLARKRQLEKERYRRLKEDKAKLLELKEKKKNYYETKKNSGKIKSINNLTPREQRLKRKQWKKNSRKYRNKKKELAEQEKAHMINTTPPDSEEDTNPVGQQEIRQSLLTVTDEIHNSSPASDRRATVGRQRATRNRIMKNKLLKKKDEVISNLQSKLQYYQKKLSKFIAKKKCKSNSPMSKVQRTLKYNSTSDIKKKLLFAEVMKEQLSENVRKLKSQKEKQVFASAIVGDVVKKYNVLAKEKILTHKRVAAVTTNDKILHTKRKPRKDKISEKTKVNIINFLEQDNHSRLCSGKKETLTKDKDKKQKRYLLFSFKQLHTKYNRENTPVSLTTFYKCRPFWIIKPSVHDRDTCLCTTHANFDLLLEALHKREIVNVATFNKFLESICCDKYNEACLARQCVTCKTRKVDYAEFDNSVKINYTQWENIVEEVYMKKTKTCKAVKKVAKVQHSDNPYNVVMKLEDYVPKFMQHQMNITHQYGAIKSLKDKLTAEEVLIHADFSENYATKYSSEIQAFHFGGSRNQICLHTVVVYYKDKDGNTTQQCFCTLSEILDHDAAAIWSHLKPVLDWISSSLESVSTLHFLSDGPVTQYRNRYMFYILANKVKFFFPKLQMLSWNYSEAGHGKGAPDGVGATCKRTADMLVAQGEDIVDIASLSKALQDHCENIKIYTITEDDFERVQLSAIGKPPRPFSGTLKVHQVVCKRDTFKLNMKYLSCFCKNMFECHHYMIGCLDFVKDYGRQMENQTIYSNSESEMDMVEDARAGNEEENTYSDYASAKQREDNTIYSSSDEMFLADYARAGKNKENTYLDDDNNCITVSKKQANAASTSGIYDMTNLPLPGESEKVRYRNGDYVLVKFKTKSSYYRYVGLCVGEMDDDDGEIKVTFLKIASNDGKLFKIDENAVYDVPFEDIIEHLPQPVLHLKGERIYYKFKKPVSVFEQ